MGSNLLSAAYAFNLVCTYTQSSINSEVLKDNVNPYPVVYRLDLNERKYCEENCEEIRSIKSIDRNFIYLEYAENTELSTIRVLKLNRVSGKIQNVIAIGSRIDQHFGVCERRAFSGFPRSKF